MGRTRVSACVLGMYKRVSTCVLGKNTRKYMCTWEERALSTGVLAKNELRVQTTLEYSLTTSGRKGTLDKSAKKGILDGPVKLTRHT